MVRPVPLRANCFSSPRSQNDILDGMPVFPRRVQLLLRADDLQVPQQSARRFPSQLVELLLLGSGVPSTFVRCARVVLRPGRGCRQRVPEEAFRAPGLSVAGPADRSAGITAVRCRRRSPACGANESGQLPPWRVLSAGTQVCPSHLRRYITHSWPRRAMIFAWASLMSCRILNFIAGSKVIASCSIR